MFRGEPIALQMILMGLIFFLITQILGILMPGVIYVSPPVFVRGAHFIIAYFGWIGFVILGAQLQFFKAITNIRRYEPLFLRPTYLITLLLGVVSIAFSQIFENSFALWAGITLYLIGIGIHSYWLLPKIRSKLFKFPLNYLIGSHIYLIYAIILLVRKAIVDPFVLADNFEIIHILSIGWISMNLQGAIIRILPMFVGRAIDRPMRKYVDVNFWVSFISSAVLIDGLITNLRILIMLGAFFWVCSWIWVVIVLIRSLRSGHKELQYKITLGFFGSGFLFLIIGALIGFQFEFQWFHTYIPRAVHIHLSLLAGLSLIMLGAIQRITSFQIFTLLYTGRRQEAVNIDYFMHISIAKVVLGFVISGPMLLIFGFITNESIFILIGALTNIVGVTIFTVMILGNFVFYLRHKHEAIPFWEKPSEVSGK